MEENRDMRKGTVFAVTFFLLAGIPGATTPNFSGEIQVQTRPAERAEEDPLPPAYRVVLPEKPWPFPTPRPDGGPPKFKLIGTKGWAWTWDQYLAEIPVLARYGMNFFMSCYTSVFADTEKFINRWWEPLPPETKRGIAAVAAACREKGLAFCYAMHPGLFTERPLRYDNDEDFEALWPHYDWVQGLGVKWFCLSYDDIGSAGQDMAETGAAHGRLANKLFDRLRAKDPEAQLIFCPVYYWGRGGTKEARPYLEALGRTLRKDAFLFWTGDGVVTLKITRACAESFKNIVRHRLVIWDNYPVNDRTGALHLGPVTGRDPDLDEVAYGYMSNPHCPQNEINRIPLLTCADYAFNPRAYDPARSIGQAIVHLASTSAQRQVLKDLVELNPGNLLRGNTSVAWNGAVERLKEILRGADPKKRGAEFIRKVEDIAARLTKEFPASYPRTKETLSGHVAQLKDLFGSSFPILSKAVLKDKIKGGWAGQTIGCTFGGPTEFRFKGTFIPDYQPIDWSDGAILSAFKNSPGLYDDVYMDLTFVDVLEKEGLDAPAAVLAKAFANARYPLWHANQMARYNILRGVLPPASGHWLNNPHADDIDFEIEADFAGLMSPGMPNAAAEVSDRAGHIMNFGDGWYGGVYIAALYALAFVRDDVERVAEEALAVLPPQSSFARTMDNVIRWHREDPADWQGCWFKVWKKWSEDVGCPEGVFSSFNIDAKINAAWVLVGLLYGEGDFGKTISIAARCGDDSDCNPASAGGILGTMLGYEKIPTYWRKGLAAAEGLPFPYVNISLREAYDLSFKHALEQVAKGGGRITAQDVEIVSPPIEAVPLEIGFDGHHPVERRPLAIELKDAFSFSFDGVGFAVNGEAVSRDGAPHRPVVAMSVDGGTAETLAFPTDHLFRAPTLFWKYALSPGRHTVGLKLIREGPPVRASVRLADVVIYGSRPSTPKH
jgi:hypothetical protein